MNGKEQDRQIAKAMNAIRRDEVMKGLKRLVSAGARVELMNCLEGLPPKVIETLQMGQTEVAIDIYKLLDDDAQLLSIAERLLLPERYRESLKAVLAYSNLTGKRQEFLEKFLERGAYLEVSQLMRVVFPEAVVQSDKTLESATYQNVIGHMKNKLLSSFYPEETGTVTAVISADTGSHEPPKFIREVKPGHDLSVVRAPMRHMLDTLEYCQEYWLVLEFYNNCEVTKDCTEWQYFTGKKLLAMSKLDSYRLPEKVIDFMSTEALLRDDDSVIGLILTYRFDATQGILFAKRLAQKGERKQAAELFLRVLQEDGTNTVALQGLQALMKYLPDEKREKPEKKKRYKR